MAAWAYTYEVLSISLVDDHTFDSECAKIRPEIGTGNEVLDEFFRTKFAAYTGSWIHKHPELQKLLRVVKLKLDHAGIDTPAELLTELSSGNP